MIPDIKKNEKSFHFSRFPSYTSFLKRKLYQLFKLRILEPFFGLFANEQLSLQCYLEMKNKTFKGLSNISHSGTSNILQPLRQKITQRSQKKTDFQLVLGTQFPLVSFKIALLVIKYQTKVLKLSITSAKILSRLLSQTGFGRNTTATFVVSI